MSTPPLPADPVGQFVAIEGLDGSGGTTQLARLAVALEQRGRVVVRTREPSDGPVGRLIRAQLAAPGAAAPDAEPPVGDDVLPYLFAADRRDHLDRVVLPGVARGDVVLTDRYALSSFAYQAEAHGLDRVMALNHGFPPPQVTVMLALAPERCLARIEARGGTRDRFETLDRLRRILDAYTAAIHRCRELGWTIVEIDADRSVDAVHDDVLAAVLAGAPAAGRER